MDLVLGDSFSYLDQLETDSVDLILTDPPYNIGSYSTGNIKFSWRSEINNDVSDWDLIQFDPARVLAQFKRVLKPDGNIFAFTSYNQIGRWHEVFDPEFDTFQFMVWHKTNPVPKVFKNGFLNSCELIVCMWNKGHKWNFLGQKAMHNFIETPICMGSERLKSPKHPTQKPVAVLEKIIRVASNYGDVVLDPFMGVGSTGVASLRLGRKFIGVEIDPEYYEASVSRLSEVQPVYNLNDPRYYLQGRVSLGSYPGGKSDRKKHSHLYMVTPNQISTLVEPFAGLGSYTIVNSPKTGRAIVNDVDPEVVSFLRCIADPDLLMSLVEKVRQIYPVSREDYFKWREFRPKSLLDRALRRVVIQNCSFSGAGGGYSSSKAGRSWHLNRPKQWSVVAKIFQDLSIEIHNLDYREFLNMVVANHQKGLLGSSPLVYLDPPYHEVAVKGSLYEYNSVGLDDLLDTVSLLHSEGISWIMSNRDTPEVRKVFKKYYQLSYNTYNDMNNTHASNPELLVSNRLLSL